MTEKQARNFWKKVNKTNTCWLWTAVCSDNGYGRMKMGTRHKMAHRISWEMHFDPIPVGLIVCHKCDTPKCVRPDHLFVGTVKDNAQDMVRKGRHGDTSGTKNVSAKLTDEQVIEIRQKYASNQYTLKALSYENRVSLSLIHNIVSGKAWKHLLKKP